MKFEKFWDIIHDNGYGIVAMNKLESEHPLYILQFYGSLTNEDLRFLRDRLTEEMEERLDGINVVIINKEIDKIEGASLEDLIYDIGIETLKEKIEEIEIEAENHNLMLQDAQEERMGNQADK